jgi:hypothetical protein
MVGLPRSYSWTVPPALLIRDRGNTIRDELRRRNIEERLGRVEIDFDWPCLASAYS